MGYLVGVQGSVPYEELVVGTQLLSNLMQWNIVH